MCKVPDGGRDAEIPSSLILTNTLRWRVLFIPIVYMKSLAKSVARLKIDDVLE
jgi:hypothetical protein